MKHDEIIRALQERILEETGQQLSRTVVDHLLHPRNPGAMDHPDGHAKITGPCGDTMEIFIRVEGATIAGASFLTDGCGTTLVSASMAVELALDRTVHDARTITQEMILERLGGLPEGSQHCALLAANTLQACLDDHDGTRRQPWKRLYRTKPR